jgi:hypothetical protein
MIIAKNSRRYVCKWEWRKKQLHGLYYNIDIGSGSVFPPVRVIAIDKILPK